MPSLSARPVVTFPAAERHGRLASTKLYCSVTDAHVCESLVQSHYMKMEWKRIDCSCDVLTIIPPRHTHGVAGNVTAGLAESNDSQIYSQISYRLTS